jgi:hypothetical protein
MALAIGYSALDTFVDYSLGVLTPVLPGREGALYGTTFRSGAASWGSVYKLWLPETPVVDSITARGAAGAIGWRVSGASGEKYQLLRSADLSTWTVVSNFTMPLLAFYTWFDSTDAHQVSFYRVLRMPQ